MNSSKSTISKELFKNSTILSCIILLVFGVLLSSILYYSELANAKAIIRQRNQAVTYFIEGYFTKFHNSVDFLSSNPDIINASQFDSTNSAKILSLYQALQNSDPDINYIYSGYSDGSLLINNYTPPPEYNSTLRPWYTAALNVHPDISGGIPYQDINTQEWLISISRVITGVDGGVNGVVSIDCSIDTIANLLKQGDGYFNSSYSFVANMDGNIIIHQDNELIAHSINDSFNSTVDISKESGEFKFTYANSEKLAHFSHINQIGWIVVTVVDKNEILQPIIIKICVSICIIAGLAALLGWFLSANLSKRIIKPLEELKYRVSNIMASSGEDTFTYNYPNNEIGTIAADIEKLAGQELYKKNLQLQNINQELIILSTTDQLTKLFNRRKMDSELVSELTRSLRYKQSFSIIMFDIDLFKAINDNFGHQTGDHVLIDIANILRTTLRSSDITSRWGGDEFMILCPQTNLDGAVVMAENIRMAIANHRFNLTKNITISLGVSEVSGHETVADILKDVDKKLYTAKNQGRNQVVS